MSICITITKRGYRYTCNCGDADIELYSDGYLCLSCDSWRSVDSCAAESRAAKKAAIRKAYIEATPNWIENEQQEE